jgi:Tfp pilus assembly protein PilF
MADRFKHGSDRPPFPDGHLQVCHAGDEIINPGELVKNRFKVFLLFFTLGFLIYANGLNNNFLMDDGVFMSDPFLSQAKYAFSQWNPYSREVQHFGYYRPLAHMILDFYYDTFKNIRWGYHLLNIFLFVSASCLVYILVVQITGSFPLGFLSGLFYLIHPINQIAVDYVSGIVFACQAVFMLGALLLLWASLEKGNNRLLYYLSLLFSFLSLFWHENAVLVPFYISAVILLFRPEPLKKKLLYLCPYFLIGFAFLIFRLNFLGLNEPIKEIIKLDHMTAGQYLDSLFKIYIWYISRLFYPHGIVLGLTAPIVRNHTILGAVGLCLLLALFWLLFVVFSKQKIYQLGITWILIGLLPVSLAAFIRPDFGVMVEPHWFIISSIGFFILAAGCCLFVLQRLRKTGAVLLFVVVFIWGSFSYAYTGIWADQKTYALYWIHQAPEMDQPYYYLAQAYQEQGAFNEAGKYYKVVMSKTFNVERVFDVLNNIGFMEAEKHNLRQAQLYLEMASKISPYSPEVYNNLCALYDMEGGLSKAEAYCKQALAIDPLFIQARRGLAGIALKRGNYRLAVALCLKDLEIANNDPQTLDLLVDIFIQKKDLVDASQYAYRFVNSSTDPYGLTALGAKMAEHGLPLVALDCFDKAIRIAPEYGDAYLKSGDLWATLGKYDHAIRLWRIGSSMCPSDRRFQIDIAKARFAAPGVK